MDTITTMNRKLEQFFYLHGVDYIDCSKNEDGMTVWTYRKTPEVDGILVEWRLAQAKRAKKKGV